MDIDDNTIKALFKADFETFTVDDRIYQEVYDSLVSFFKRDELIEWEGTQDGEEWDENFYSNG